MFDHPNYLYSSFILGLVLLRSAMLCLLKLQRTMKEVLYLRRNEHHSRAYFETLVTLLQT